MKRLKKYYYTQRFLNGAQFKNFLEIVNKNLKINGNSKIILQRYSKSTYV